MPKIRCFLDSLWYIRILNIIMKCLCLYWVYNNLFDGENEFDRERTGGENEYQRLIVVGGNAYAWMGLRGTQCRWKRGKARTCTRTCWLNEVWQLGMSVLTPGHVN